MQRQAELNELPRERRSRKRSTVLLAATLETDQQSLKANLLNLSATGAQLDAAVPPDMHARLTLSRGSLAARGRVICASEQRFGILFDEPIDEAVLAEHADAATGRKRVVPLR